MLRVEIGYDNVYSTRLGTIPVAPNLQRIVGWAAVMRVTSNRCMNAEGHAVSDVAPDLAIPSDGRVGAMRQRLLDGEQYQEHPFGDARRIAVPA